MPAASAQPLPPVREAKPIKVRGRPRLDLFDARTGALRGRLFPLGSFKGALLILEADVNGDGVADLIVEAIPRGRPPRTVFPVFPVFPVFLPWDGAFPVFVPGDGAFPVLPADPWGSRGGIAVAHGDTMLVLSE
jgi:hypothetical protein